MKKLFRRLSETRWWVLLLGVTGIAALFFLAASLNDMEFKPAIHYVPPGEASRPSPEFLQSMLSASFVEQILLAGVFVVILCVVLLLLTPEGRKRLLKTLVRTVLMFLVIYWAINKYRQPEEVVEEAGGGRREWASKIRRWRGWWRCIRLRPCRRGWCS